MISKLSWAWERYRLLAFLVAAVAIVVVVVSPLTGCAAVPTRTAAPTTDRKQLANPSISHPTTSYGPRLLIPLLVIGGLAVFHLKRTYEQSRHNN